MFRDRPLKRELSGLALEYRIIQLYSRDAGKREAKISFNVGQGTQDLGFRSDVDVLFTCEPAVPVVLDVRDEDGRPTMASFVFRDRDGPGLSLAQPPAGARLLLPSPGLSPERRDRAPAAGDLPGRVHPRAGVPDPDPDDHGAQGARPITRRSSSSAGSTWPR